jgi:hypothetical protein
MKMLISGDAHLKPDLSARIETTRDGDNAVFKIINAPMVEDLVAKIMVLDKVSFTKTSQRITWITATMNKWDYGFIVDVIQNRMGSTVASAHSMQESYDWFYKEWSKRFDYEAGECWVSCKNDMYFKLAEQVIESYCAILATTSGRKLRFKCACAKTFATIQQTILNHWWHYQVELDGFNEHYLKNL